MTKSLNEMLNPKQIDFIKYEDKRINLLTGSVRSGKTYVSLLKWAIFVGTMPSNNEFLMTGKTLTSLKRNCLGLLQELVGNNNFTYSISQKSGKLFGRTIWLEGANDDRAESKIRGMTLAGAYVDELTQIPEDFYKMLLSRLSVKNAKLYATTNPDTPNHWVKKDIIDNTEIEKKVWNFILDDNEILKKENEEYFENLKKEYKSMGGVFYERFILGLWVLAEGLIYRQFVDNKELFLKDEAVDKNGNKINFMIISIGIDYGATKGETEFKATGITQYFKEVWTIDEEKLAGLHTPEEMYEKFIEFYKRVVDKYGKVTHAFGDYGALGQVLTYGMNRYLQQHSVPLKIQDCIKGKIIDRIYMDQMLFAKGKRFILKKCKYLIEAYEQAVWDDKHEDERLDDGTTPIDDLDASEYSMFPFYDKLMLNIKGGIK
jgi:PBSX family phage terminase large subunit